MGLWRRPQPGSGYKPFAGASADTKSNADTNTHNVAYTLAIADAPNAAGSSFGSAAQSGVLVAASSAPV